MNNNHYAWYDSPEAESSVTASVFIGQDNVVYAANWEHTRWEPVYAPYGYIHPSQDGPAEKMTWEEYQRRIRLNLRLW